jgi:tetratricopeptide (TPR) repeat protein
VLAEVSRFAMLAGEQEEAIRAGRDALRMAERLGLSDLVPALLNNVGTARAVLGDSDGIADLERAVELALAASNPEAARVYNNLASVLVARGERRRATELWEEGRRVAERLGNSVVGRYIERNLLWRDFDGGRWDDLLRTAERLLAEAETVAPHSQDYSLHRFRALILLARGETEDAVAAAASALELVRAVRDPQALLPALGMAAHVYAEAGREDEARAAAREWLSHIGPGAQWGELPLSLAAGRLGLEAEAIAALEELRERTVWGDLALAVLRGELVEAADRLGELEALPWEAEVRLRAAEALVAAGRRAEADEQLQRALAFFHSVGATRSVRRGEALLAASA